MTGAGSGWVGIAMLIVTLIAAKPEQTFVFMTLLLLLSLLLFLLLFSYYY